MFESLGLHAVTSARPRGPEDGPQTHHVQENMTDADVPLLKAAEEHQLQHNPTWVKTTAEAGNKPAARTIRVRQVDSWVAHSNVMRFNGICQERRFTVIYQLC